jgi:hypothetical protein
MERVLELIPLGITPDTESDNTTRMRQYTAEVAVLRKPLIKGFDAVEVHAASLIVEQTLFIHIEPSLHQPDLF